MFRTCHGNFDQQSEKRLSNGGNGRGACVSFLNTVAGLGVLLVFMTSDPSGETVNEIHPHLVTGDETHNNRLHHNTVGLTPIYLLPT